MSIVYANPKNIEQEATFILTRMTNIEWGLLSIDQKAIELTNNLAELWKVHPFREGNTRTIVTFVCQFAESREIRLDRSLFEQNATYMRSALVAATAIFSDGDFRKSEYLFNIIKDSIELGLELK